MKNKNLTEIRANVRIKLLDYRAMEYYLNTGKFERVWELCEDKEELVKMIDCLNLISLKRYCERILSADQEEKTLRQLREIASSLGIPCYSQYDKETLIQLIKGHKKNEEVREN